jgi:polar amino acid transport system substrate-binding protein
MLKFKKKGLSMKILACTIFLILSLNSKANEIVVSGIRESMNSEISYLVLKEAYERIGFKLTWRAVNANDSLKESNDGQVDGELFRIAGVQKRFGNLLKVPTAINVLQAVAYSHKKDLKVDRWASLSNFRIGYQKGVKFAENGARNLKTTTFDSTSELLNALESKRIDVAVLSRVNGIDETTKNNYSNIFEIKPYIQTYELFHFLNKKNEQFVFKLNKVLLSMKKKGRIKEIREDFLSSLKKKKLIEN